MLDERYSIASQRKIKKMHYKDAMDIIDRVNSMRSSPFPRNAARCKDNEFRENVFELIHFGYRILYELNFEDNVILIHNIEEC